jgi:hypothetical protein
MARQSKSGRELEREINRIFITLNYIDAGKLDHLFPDAEIKAAMRAAWMARWETAVRKYVQTFPGQFYETPDGKIVVVPEGSNVGSLPAGDIPPCPSGN